MFREWFSATRVTGLAAYGVSFAVCSLRALQWRRGDAAARIFTVLAWVQLALLADMAFDWRWRLHEFWMKQAMDYGVYDSRRGPQLIALCILAGALLGLCVVLAVRLRKRPGGALAVVGTTLSVGLWCCEVISYHALDQALYRMVGNAMMVSLVWCLLAMLTCAGAWIDFRSRKPAMPRPSR